MTKQDVYFWQIQWAGRWMITHTRFTEEAIKREHPEAVCVQDSREERLVPDTPMEKVFSHFRAVNQAPYRGTGFQQRSVS